MNKHEEVKFNFHPRETEVVSIKIPTDTLQSIQKVADSKDMSVEALLKFYIGQGVRQDLKSDRLNNLPTST